MHAYTGTIESPFVTGRTAKVWPSGAIEIHQDGEFVRETVIAQDITYAELHLLISDNDETAARIIAMVTTTSAVTKSYWEETVTVPIGRDEIDLTRSEVKRIARQWNAYRNLRRAGQTFDQFNQLRDIRKGVKVEFGLSNKEMGLITNWYNDNLYDTNNASTWI